MTKVTPRADRVIDGTHGKLGADFPEGKVKKKKKKVSGLAEKMSGVYR